MKSLGSQKFTVASDSIAKIRTEFHGFLVSSTVFLRNGRFLKKKVNYWYLRSRSCPLTNWSVVCGEKRKSAGFQRFLFSNCRSSPWGWSRNLATKIFSNRSQSIHRWDKFHKSLALFNHFDFESIVIWSDNVSDWCCNKRWDWRTESSDGGYRRSPCAILRTEPISLSACR